MPLELLARMPPIMAAWSDAGSGPILARQAFSRALTAPPTTPGPTRTFRPPSRTSTFRQSRDKSTRSPSVTACPDRLVPAARNVTGTLWVRQSANSWRTCSTERGRTTARGTIR